MKMIEAMRLTRQYAECPKCGNIHVGNGEGKVVIEDSTFYRSCKCGWEITVKEGGSE